MTKSDQHHSMFELFDAIREGTASDEQFIELDQLIARDKKACKYYYEYFNLCSTLKSGKAIEEGRAVCLEQPQEAVCDMKLWEEMAKDEHLSPTIEVPKPKPVKKPREIVKVGQYPKLKRTIQKSNLYTLIISSAALIFIIIFLNIAPVRTPHEVATLRGTFDARWATSEIDIQDGLRISRKQKPFVLDQGFAEILFDNESVVTIEGPARFSLQSGRRMKLDYGKLYAVVADDVQGFTVQAGQAEIIDLGTEFGVHKLRDGEAIVHVTKGKVRLNAGFESSISQILTQSQAAAATVDQRIKPVQFFGNTFVRDIEQVRVPPNTQKRTTDLCLADVVAGGDGFSNTSSLRGIEPSSGRVRQTATRFKKRFGYEGNHGLGQSEFIDSVFIPDDGPIQVSSASHKFKRFKDTNQFFWSDITTDLRIPDEMVAGSNPDGLFPRLNGKTYGRPQDEQAILLAPNAGITFDLQTIRQTHPGQAIDSLRAVCGIPENTKQPSHKIRFWVLVDGVQKKVFEADPDGQKTQVIRVSISPDDRFLSLVTTIEGNSMQNCWALFAQPKLIFDEKQ